MLGRVQNDRRGPPVTADLSSDPLTLRLSRGDAIFGERLLPIADGPVPIRGATHAALALRETGSTVLVVTIPSVSTRAAIDAADHLDRLAEMGEQGLADLAGRGIPEIRRDYQSFFDRDPPTLNRDDSLILVVDRDPSADTWDTLAAELGDRFLGAYRISGEGAIQVRDPKRSGLAGVIRMPWVAWLGVVGFFVGGALALYGLTRGDDPSSDQQAPIARASASLGTVASGSPVGATLSRWVGQQKFVRMSTGHLVFLYPEPGQLTIVRDQRDLGRAWRSPQAIEGIETETLSVAIDGRDRIHLVYSNDEGTTYLRLIERDSSWVTDAELDLDPEGTGAVVDIEWDLSNEVAHVTWTRATDDGEQPIWGVIDGAEAPTLVTSEPLADPGDATALSTIAAGSGGRVVAGYRKPASPEGWFTRDVEESGGTFSLGEEEVLRDSDDVIGAASLEVDDEGIAHLVLRNDATFDLTYYRGRPGAGWTNGTLVMDGSKTDHVEHPTLSIDEGSSLMYLYIQTNAFLEDSTEVRMVVRDPATGWSGPFAITDRAEIPGGAVYPTTMGVIDGQPLVAWSTLGGGPSINIARVVAP